MAKMRLKDATEKQFEETAQALRTGNPLPPGMTIDPTTEPFIFAIHEDDVEAINKEHEKERKEAERLAVLDAEMNEANLRAETIATAPRRGPRKVETPTNTE